ncbi:MAG: flagellar basal body P-ring formation protein FlgA [Phycisphaerales bacterium]|nr:flagellar basal body P-ring formation protein FlgA [Phycisphaerales bacterium]
MTRLLLIVVLALSALSLCGAALGGQIALRSSARVPAERAVLLSDIADLTGHEAQALAGVEVHAPLAHGARAAATEREVRAALDRHGVNWGRVTLRGSTCELIAPAAAKPEAPPRPAPQEPAPKHVVIDAAGAPTVRTAAAQTLARLFEVELHDLQIAFDDPDGSLLSVSGAGRRIDAQPAASANGSRIPMNIWVYEADAVVASGIIRADVRVRRTAVIASGALRRGQEISSGDVTLETLWMEPGAGRPITSIDEAVGQVCRTRIPAGTALRADHVERAVIVRRGDLVTVHCVAGGVVVKTPARAQTDGRDGDVIEFKVDRSRRPFLARMSGPGRAVMIAGAGRTEDER